MGLGDLRPGGQGFIYLSILFEISLHHQLSLHSYLNPLPTQSIELLKIQLKAIRTGPGLPHSLMTDHIPKVDEREEPVRSSPWS